MTYYYISYANSTEYLATRNHRNTEVSKQVSVINTKVQVFIGSSGYLYSDLFFLPLYTTTDLKCINPDVTEVKRL